MNHDGHENEPGVLLSGEDGRLFARVTGEHETPEGDVFEVVFAGAPGGQIDKLAQYIKSGDLLAVRFIVRKPETPPAPKWPTPSINGYKVKVSVDVAKCYTEPSEAKPHPSIIRRRGQLVDVYEVRDDKWLCVWPAPGRVSALVLWVRGEDVEMV